MNRFLVHLLFFASCSPSSFFKKNRTKLSLVGLATITIIYLYTRSKKPPKPFDGKSKKTNDHQEQTKTNNDIDTFQKKIDYTHAPEQKLEEPLIADNITTLPEKSAAQAEEKQPHQITISKVPQQKIDENTTWEDLFNKKSPYYKWDKINIIFNAIDPKIPADQRYSLSIKPASLEKIDFDISQLKSLTKIAEKDWNNKVTINNKDLAESFYSMNTIQDAKDDITQFSFRKYIEHRAPEVKNRATDEKNILKSPLALYTKIKSHIEEYKKRKEDRFETLNKILYTLEQKNATSSMNNMISSFKKSNEDRNDTGYYFNTLIDVLKAAIQEKQADLKKTIVIFFDFDKTLRNDFSRNTNSMQFLIDKAFVAKFNEAQQLGILMFGLTRACYSMEQQAKAFKAIGITFNSLFESNNKEMPLFEDEFKETHVHYEGIITAADKKIDDNDSTCSKGISFLRAIYLIDKKFATPDKIFYVDDDTYQLTEAAYYFSQLHDEKYKDTELSLIINNYNKNFPETRIEVENLDTQNPTVTYHA